MIAVADGKQAVEMLRHKEFRPEIALGHQNQRAADVTVPRRNRVDAISYNVLAIAMWTYPNNDHFN